MRQRIGIKYKYANTRPNRCPHTRRPVKSFLRKYDKYVCKDDNLM